MKIRRCILWSCVFLLLCAGACAEDRIIFDPADLPQQGAFYPLERLGIQLFLPEDWQAVDVPQEMQAQNLEAFFLSQESGQTMAVTYGTLITDAQGQAVTGLSTLTGMFQQAGYADAHEAVINGLPCMIYSSAAEDVMGAYFLTQGEKLLAVHISPMAGQANYALAQGLLSSIMAVDVP